MTAAGLFTLANFIMTIVAFATYNDTKNQKCVDGCGSFRTCDASMDAIAEESAADAVCTANTAFYCLWTVPAGLMLSWIFFSISQNMRNQKGTIHSFGVVLWLYMGIPYYVMCVNLFNGFYGRHVGAGVVMMWWCLFCSLCGVYFHSPDLKLRGFQLQFWKDPNRRTAVDWINANGVIVLQGKPEGCSCLPGRCGGFNQNLSSQGWFNNMPKELEKFDMGESQWNQWMQELNEVQAQHEVCNGFRFLNFLACFPLLIPNILWFVCMWVLPISHADPFQTGMKAWLKRVNNILRPQKGLCKALTFAETTTGGGYWKDGSLSIIVIAYREEEVERLERTPVLQQGNSGDPNWGCWGLTVSFKNSIRWISLIPLC